MRCFMLTVLLAACAAAAQEPLTVATKVAAPFAMKDDEGTWRGVSIELWEVIADELGVEYDYQEMELEEMLDAVAAGDVDVGIAALTVTADREERLDFTHPFYHSGLGIAVVPERSASIWGAIRRLVSVQFLQAVVALAGLLMAVGVVVWLFERRKNAEQFGGAVRGLGSGFWWSAVTMTTVGYGDKAPTTFGGRVVALVWMFASIIIISGFTAAIASALTVSSLGSSVSGPDDLIHARTGTVAGSSAETNLRDLGVRLQLYDTIEEGVDGLAAGNIDALVYDAPILRFTIAQRDDANLGVLAIEFEQQDYAIALPPASPLREQINTVLLEYAGTVEWKALKQKFIGR